MGYGQTVSLPSSLSAPMPVVMPLMSVTKSCTDSSEERQSIQGPTLTNLNMEEGQFTRASTRHDRNANTYMATLTNGLDWSRVIRRITYDADTMENINDE